jgi:hypothetical protein
MVLVTQDTGAVPEFPPADSHADGGWTESWGTPAVTATADGTADLADTCDVSVTGSAISLDTTGLAPWGTG